MRALGWIAVVMLFGSSTSFARVVTDQFDLRGRIIENRAINLKTELEDARIRIDRNAELVEVVVEARSISRDAYLTLEAGDYFNEQMVRNISRDVIFRLNSRESRDSIGRWEMYADGAVRIDRVYVTYDDNGRDDSRGYVELMRYYKSSGERDHMSTTSTRVPSGYRYEGTLGHILDYRAANTRPLYQCKLAGRDFFASVNRNCEGQRYEGIIGYVYESQVANTKPIYRCNDGYDHFISEYRNCEGAGTNEHILGYVKY